jgi:hypothetical protein
MFYMQRNLVAAIHEDRHREAEAERLSGATRLTAGVARHRERGILGLFGTRSTSGDRHSVRTSPLSIRPSTLRAGSAASPPTV